jgi:hypothetical protein
MQVLAKSWPHCLLVCGNLVGCTIVVQMLLNGAILHENGASHPNITVDSEHQGVKRGILLNRCFDAKNGALPAEHLLNFRAQMRVFRCDREVSNANKTKENRSVRRGQGELANRRIQPLCHLSAAYRAESSANGLPVQRSSPDESREYSTKAVQVEGQNAPEAAKAEV